MMMGIISLIFFFGGLVFFGWQVARFILKINRVELLMPLSLAIGYGIYTFFLNIFSYLIPIRLNFYIIFLFLLIVAFSLFFLNKSRPDLEWGLSKKEGSVIFLAVFVIMALSALLASRSIGADDLAYTHLPAVASIVGGNFPPKNLNLPDYDLVMHYGPHLFFAAISRISGFSVFFAFHLSVFLFSGVIFLLIFNIAKLFIRDNKSSFLVALVGMFGGGFRFIYGFGGLVSLYRNFFLGWDIEHPFKLFGYMWKAQPVTSSLVGSFYLTNWAALYWSLFLAIIYLYLRNVNKEKWSYWHDFLLIILLSILALNNEMAFLVIGFGILVVPFILYFQDKDKERFKILLKHTFIVFIATSVIVLFQGGTITAILKSIIQNQSSAGYGAGLGFSFLKYPFSFDIGKEALPFYGLKFILCFGLIYFLIIPATIFISKKYFRKTIFLVVVSFFSFLVPLIISFNWLWQGTLSHFFRVSSLIWAIVVGLFLVRVLSQLGAKSIFRKIIYFCLIVVCLEGVLLLLTRPLYKKDEPMLDNDSFFAKLTTPTEIEFRAYDWVEQNSSIKDYFLVFADKDDIDNQPTVFENFRFVMFSQRLAPIYTHNNNYIIPYLPQDDYYTPIYKRLVSDCNRDDMKILNYKYLFVDSNWPSDLEEKCLVNNDLELEFESKGGNEFIRIYKVNNN